MLCCQEMRVDLEDWEAEEILTNYRKMRHTLFTSIQAVRQAVASRHAAIGWHRCRQAEEMGTQACG